MRIRKLESKHLPLTNDGRLSLFFLGVGSAFSKRHYQTNLLIVKGDDHLMIDFGSKAPQALYELGLPVTDIRNFLITHSHSDHIGGLEEVMLTNRYVRRERPRIVINPTYQSILWDMSLRGGSAFNEERGGEVLTFADMWEVIRPTWLESYPRETHEAEVGSINVKFFRTMHIPDWPDNWQSSFWSCGVLIDDRIMYTCDTRFDPDLVFSFENLFEPEIIFHDCQFFTGGVHAGIEELRTLPSEIKQKMVLVHYGDNWEEYEDKIEEFGFKALGQEWVFYDFDEWRPR